MMVNSKIDVELVGSVSLEIVDRIKLIMKLFPERSEYKDETLRHLASASLHLALFIKDICDVSRGEKTSMDEDLVKQFLDTCRCKGIEIKYDR